MPPSTRSSTAKTKGSQVDSAVLVDLVTDNTGDARSSNKRRRTDAGPNVLQSATAESNSSSSSSRPSVVSAAVKERLPDKNAHLKGRKRFTADFADLKEECGTGFVVNGLQIKKIRAGDEEGALEVSIAHADGRKVLTVNLQISDSSDYPKEHSFFCFSEDADHLPSRIQAVVEDLASASSKPLRDTVERLLINVSRALKVDENTQNTQDEDVEMEDEGTGDEEEMYDDYEDMIASQSDLQSQLSLSKLQLDFIDTVATGFRPGFLRFGHDGFALSVSLPVTTLAESIPPQALMAWDRRLLSSAQYLNLLITGFRSVYPPIANDGNYTVPAQRLGVSLRFTVGLTKRYKPSKEHAKQASLTFGLIAPDAEDKLRIEEERAALQAQEDLEWEQGVFGDRPMPAQEEIQEEEEEDNGRIDRFSLSSSLESLMNQEFLKVVQYRRQFHLGWAGAEVLHAEVEKTQCKAEDVLAAKRKVILKADSDEAKLGQTNALPHDPLASLGSREEINLPLTAFCYLVRRMMLCTRFCIVCHNKLETDFEALKPYVCDSKLCSYQYYSLNRGPSLEYEILHNPRTVDLLVSLAYVGAHDHALDEPLPIGMGLQVPLPNVTATPTAPVSFYQPAQPVVPDVLTSPTPGSDGLVEFDALSKTQMRASIVFLLNTLPTVLEMKKHLDRKVKAGKSKPKLKDLDPEVLPAAWLLLRWCVASCTAYLEEITSQDEIIQNVDPNWRQFRFIVGAPDAEAKFKQAVAMAQAKNANAVRYPSLFAFHGSPVKNWHSIIRHGLWYKSIANGRAYGNGVYLAKDSTVSMGHYAGGASTTWRKSELNATNCVALAEIVNLPQEFVSNNPYFVVQETHWIMCRYLLVRASPRDTDGAADWDNSTTSSLAGASTTAVNNVTTSPSAGGKKKKKGKKQDTEATPVFMPLDPAHPTTHQNKRIEIPNMLHQIEGLLEACRLEFVEEENDEEDLEVFGHEESAAAAVSAATGGGGAKGKDKGVSSSRDEEYMLDSDEEDYDIMSASFVVPSKSKKANASGSGTGGAGSKLKRMFGKSKSSSSTTGVADWTHDASWVEQAVNNLMPPPSDASPSATMAVQRELRTMLREQEIAEESSGGLRELGWYMPPELVGDNLFQWIVEMHSFDETLPIAKDMKDKKLNSIIFEIRFPPTYPIGPPFFRILTPRFLPFIQGGGGHVTGGGSICMDLLTSDGWLPSYSISAVLMQIKLAISNLDPKPARLASNWQQPYSSHEALEGFKRAAATHGWKVPDGLDRLVR